MKEVITLFEIDSCVGTSILIQSLAEILAKDHKVLVIYASANSFCDYLYKDNYNNKSIDNLRPYLRSKNLTAKKIQKVCFQKNNVTILPPVKNLALIKYYKESDLIDIVETIKDEYDYIFIQSGASIQYSLNVSALLCATKRYIVITKHKQALNRYKLLDQTLLSPLNLEHKLLLNKYNGDKKELTFDEVKKIIGKKEILTVCLYQANYLAETNTETSLENPKFKKDINQVIREIMSDYHIVKK